MKETPFLNSSDPSPAPRRPNEEILAKAQKPARYVGLEPNSVVKDPAHTDLRIALAFPDVYEVGMSHLGLKILYSIINAQPRLAAERVFAVWPDMEGMMRERRLPLTTLESGTPLSDLHIVGFSLQYELAATTIAQMLDLGGIPLRARDRGADDPIVLGGGPCAFNPAPLAPFFDAFVLGDGEEIILELADEYLRGKAIGESRDELLARWKGIPGVYVPSLHSSGETVSRRVAADLDSAHFPLDLVTPLCETVHDRVGVEIARGCTRGCRFCQAGMLYRPVREREASTIVELARESLNRTGWDEVSLLSLSSGDYSHIGPLVEVLAKEHSEGKVALSLPSLRTETFDSDVAEQIRKVRKTGFTLAPEAGTDRLRRIINKGNTEEDLERAVKAAFKLGWRSLKLYFMIGLPGERDEDLDGIVGLIRRAAKWAGSGKITASISTFVPKAHTPFQWAAQIPPDEIVRRQKYISRYFQTGRAKVKVHDAFTTQLEGVIARGDEKIADVIESAYKKGARLDGWAEHLNRDVWMEAFGDFNIDPAEYVRERRVGEKLPWGFVKTGVSESYLEAEWAAAFAEETTGDCRTGDCLGCGVCDFEEIYPRTAGEFSAPPDPESQSPAIEREEPPRRFRARYAKMGLARFLGHRDLMRMFHRAFRRAGLKLAYSRGFHPHPRMWFSPPVSMGIESLAEFVDIELVSCDTDPSDMSARIGSALPRGIKLLEFGEISLNNSPVTGRIQQVTYEIRSFGCLSREDARRKIEEFQSVESYELVTERKGRKKRKDLKDFIVGLSFTGSTITMVLESNSSGSVNPLDAVSAILGQTKEEARAMEILKTSAAFSEPGKR